MISHATAAPITQMPRAAADNLIQSRFHRRVNALHSLSRREPERDRGRECSCAGNTGSRNNRNDSTCRS
ncbi:hypothetical protein BRAO375_3440018 [Bradyrhizobium sp. ORS 375]|nr:hypothetical protein BRAO375_3440018 [Bradyrhizobium sp. ORS 375]